MLADVGAALQGALADGGVRGLMRGAGLRVAIFDTGLPPEHGYVRHVAGAVNFCDEQTTEDRVGHSSFMAGVIASHDDCRGFAPDASLYFVRVFDSSQAPRRYPPLCPASLSRAAPRRRRRGACDESKTRTK